MPDFKPQYVPQSARDVIFLDTETTGLEPDEHEVIEIAAIRFRCDLQVEVARRERKTVMQWPEKAHAKALEVNRYTAKEWERAVPIRAALVELAEIFVEGEPILVCQNPIFDWGFLKVAFAREKLAFPSVRRIIDTQSIAWPLVMNGHLTKVDLETMCSKYGISNDGSHRAMTDVVRTAQLYAKLIGMKEPKFATPRTVSVETIPAVVEMIDPFADTVPVGGAALSDTLCAQADAQVLSGWDS